MIKTEHYDFIIENIPVVTVDMLIMKDNEILLLKRNNKPLKNIYYTPGGRVLKNECLNDAIKRKMKDELSLNFNISEPLGIMEEFFKTPDRHNINVLYYCELLEKNDIFILNDEHSEIKWFDINNTNIHEYVSKKIKIYLERKKDIASCIIINN